MDAIIGPSWWWWSAYESYKKKKEKKNLKKSVNTELQLIRVGRNRFEIHKSRPSGWRAGAKATLTTVTKLPDCAPARRGPANLPDKLIATRVHPQSLSRRFNYEYKAVV